ncbi:MAG: outer membrane protein transport protein [Nitrospirota bacterium]|nr:outer membrane protein transport protein [Nitrospirota bacterium]
MKKADSRWIKGFILLLALVAGLGLVAEDADATNGYFAHGYSIESKAMGGAGVALPQGSLDASVNPALMAFVGTRADISLSIFNPNREYTVKGDPSGFWTPFGLEEGTVKSDSKYFLVPAMGFNWSLNDKTSVGISIYGNGGMNTDYDKRTYDFFGALGPVSKPTGVDLMQLFIVPTLSVKVTPKHSIGVSPIIAYESFEAVGLEAFDNPLFSSASGKVTNNGHASAYGLGGRIGYYGELFPFLSIGASYQTKIWASKLDKYAGLFAEQGGFNIPANWTIGIAIKPTPALAFAFDVQKIYYSDVKTVANPMANLFTARLGDNGGAGFGWHDMTVYKAGVQWKSSDAWTWRAGYSYGKQPIRKDDVMFNILAPGVIEQHATAGFTRAMSKTQDLRFSLMHAFSKTVSGNNYVTNFLAGDNQKIDIKMNQWEATIGYTWKF